MNQMMKHKKGYSRKPLYRYCKVKSSIASITNLNTHAQPAQSYLEFFCLKKFELDNDVVFMESQPFTLLYEYNGRSNCVYTPDTLIKKRDGSIWIIEVKPSNKISKKMEKKFKHIAWCLWQSGIHFAFMTEKEVGSWVAMNTTLMLSCHLKSSHSDESLHWLIRKLPFICTYSEMLDIAKDAGYDVGAIMTLLGRSKLFMNMDQPLRGASLIAKAPFLNKEVAA